MRQLAAGRFVIDPQQVIHETVDGEVILIGLQTGTYYSLDGTGAEIWEGLAAGRSTEEITAELELRYAADGGVIEQAVLELVQTLLTERLVQPGLLADPAPEPGLQAATNGDRPPFSPPVLHKFTDMQDLLLVDPIHEVDDAGWPHRQPAA